MVQSICQWGTLAWLGFIFLCSVYSDFHPKSSKPADGFTGFVITLLLTMSLFFLLFGAGAFSTIFGSN